MVLKVRECGIIGLWTPEQDAARIAFFGLFALQQRRKQSANLREQIAALLEEDYIEDAIVDYVDYGRSALVLERIRSCLV